MGSLAQTLRRLRGALLVAACGSNTGCGAKSALPSGEEPSDGGFDAGVCVDAGSRPLAPAGRGYIFLVDSSSSMIGERWTAVTFSLNTLVSDDRLAGVTVALVLFPAPTDACFAFAYATPNVTAGVLAEGVDPQQAAFAQVLSEHEPTGATPLVPALGGTYDYAAKASMSDVIVMTDGAPSSCEDAGNTLDGAVAAAKNAREVSGTRTHVIGIANFAEENVKALATAGGGSAKFINVTGPLELPLLEAFIQTVGCRYELPPAGAQVALVSEAGLEENLVQVGGAAACPKTGLGGWYADHGTAVLCPEACQRAWDQKLRLTGQCDRS